MTDERKPFNPPRFTRTLGRIKVDRKLLPMTPERRKWMWMALTMLAVEYDKGEHNGTGSFRISLPVDEPDIPR